MHTLDIGLARWVLADGNYESVEFAVGKRVKFALEFFVRSYSICHDPRALAPIIGRSSFYDATGEVIYCDESAAVLDFGIISAYRDGPCKFEFGQRLHGEMGLQVDPYSYYETLHKLTDIPPLIYEWELLGISLVIDQHFIDERAKITNEAREQLLSIHKIDLVDDKTKGGADFYILHCALLDRHATKII